MDNNSEQLIDIDSFDIEFDVAQCRRYHNLTPLVEKVCKCLRCDLKFMSHGLHNRLCYFCRRELPKQYVSPPQFEHLDMGKFYKSYSRKRYYLKLLKLNKKVEDEIIMDISNQ